MGMGQQIVNGLASAYGLATNDPFAGELAARSTQYGTDQTQQAGQDSMTNSSTRSNQQLDEEVKRRLQEGKDLSGLQVDHARRMGYVSNAAANASSSRDIMKNQADILNRMYASAGQRLNDASQATQQSLGNVGNTMASLFR